MAASCCSPPLVAAILEGCELACHLKLHRRAADNKEPYLFLSATASYAVFRGFMCLVLQFPWVLTPCVRCIADIIEMQAVDRDLFSFVLQLMKHNAEDVHRKLRRTEPSPSNSPVR